MKRISALFLTILMMLPLCLTVFADGGEKEAFVPDDAFDSVFMEYPHDDGSVTMTYRDGSVGTKYADGSFEGVDGNGNRHTKDKDGTYTVYGTDGTIAVERPDGTQEMTERNGRKTVVNPDGSGKTVYANGLVIEHDADYNQTSAYFEGGKEKLKADANGEFPEGEIRGKNGEILKNTENGLYLKGANGVEYELDDEKNTSSITLPDGGTMKTEGENGEIRFADGAVFTMTGGQSKFTGADGSFVYIDKNSDAWEMFNADDGTHVKVDESGDISEMYQNNDGNVLKIENGQLTEWKDAEAGITITCDENGTTVKTPEGTYFTDGKGTVTKDGKPLGAGSEQGGSSASMPENFVPLSEVFRLEDGEGSQPYNYGKVDGFYLVLDHMESSNAMKSAKDAIYGGEPQYNPDYQTASQTISGKPSVSFTRSRKSGSASASGTYRFRHDYNGEGILHKQGEYLEFNSDLTLTISNLSFEDYHVYADMVGHINAKVEENHVIKSSESVDFNQTHVEGNIRFNDGDVCFAFHVKDDTSSHGRTGAALVFRIAGVLPNGEEEKEPAEDGYQKYSGRLTYTNGAVNKHGQPWPDLMDFDGDGDIDYADRQIQHVLVHNPDAMDTPEGVLLVMTAVIAALAGAGGGSAFAILSGSLGSGGAGLRLNLDFSGEGEAENEDPSDSSSEKESEQEKEPEQPQTPAQKEDLGPYIRRDADGDLNVKDPATGEERLYTANGDGTYTNPLTGATYTEGELKDSLDSRAENADLIRQDEAARDRAVSEQRAENEKRSQYGIEIEEKAKEELARQEAEIEHESYVEGLEIKYGEEGKELKKAIMNEQIEAEVEGNRQMAKEAYLEAGQKTAESTEKAADVAIDVLAEVTGEEGKAIKDAYTFTKSTLAKGAEAYAEGRSVTQGMVHGAIEGAVSVGQNHVDGAANKLAANVGGDMFKTALDSTAKGEKVDFTKVVESGGMAALNTAVDLGFDAAGDVVKGIGNLGDDTVATVFKTAISSESAADAAKAGINDLAKDGVEKLFKTDEDDD